MNPTPEPEPASSDDDDDTELDDPWLRQLAAAPSIPLEEPRLPPGTVIAQSYRIERTLGAGGMGVVYEATDLVLSRRIALKLHELGPSDRAARVWREARAMARLTHPHVVAVYEVGVDGSLGYIAMELVEGPNARAWVAARPRGWAEIVEVYRQAGRGLVAAHAAAIVHRDFKPDNVLVGVDGRVRVADFGLALDPDSVAVSSTVDEPRPRGVTRTGATVGTPEYMAPEQIRNEGADARSDQFAFCVALYEALFGTRPGEPATRSHEPIPAWVEAALQRGLARDPAQRYPDMQALLDALDPAPRRRRRARGLAVVIAAVVGVSLLGAGRWAAQRDETSPCDGVGAAIDEIWSEPRQQSLRQAMAERPAALRDAALATLEPGFTQWREQWRSAAHEACEAAQIRGQQSAQRLDARNDCLDRARTRFAAAIALFDDAAPESLAAAENVVARLPDLSMCARADAAIAGDVVRPERAEVHAQLRGVLDRAAAQVSAGRQDQARATLEGIIDSLELEGFTHSLAEARRLHGEVLLDMGRRVDAISSLVSALALAHGGTDRDAIASAQIALARAVGRTAAGRDEAAHLLASATAVTEDLGWSRSRRAALDLAAVEIAFFTERYEDAQRLGEPLVDDPDLDDSRRIRLMTLLATTLERQTRFDEALAAHDRVLALVERLRGPEHPQVAMVLGNRANTLLMLGRMPKAWDSLQRALQIRVAAFGPDAPVVGEIHRQLGTAAEDDTVAAEHFERALAIHRAAHDDVGLFYALAGFGRMLENRGEFARARSLLDEALAPAERAYGADSLPVARLLVNRSGLRFRDGELARGVAELERALAIMVPALSDRDVGVATARLGLARFYAALGRGDEALALFDAGQRALVAAFPSDERRKVTLMLERAKLLDQMQRAAAADVEWDAVRTYAEQHLAANDRIVLEVWLTWVEREHAAGRHAGARALLLRAQALDEGGPEAPSQRERIAGLLAARRR
ncbi:MAG: serine/threonine-protein kinase [Nannocystaceae bacterium]|nr:serine/threonine-protein kinase [Nannocystaceae bacterium]